MGQGKRGRGRKREQKDKRKAIRETRAKEKKETAKGEHMPIAGKE